MKMFVLKENHTTMENHDEDPPKKNDPLKMIWKQLPTTRDCNKWDSTILGFRE